MYEKVNPKHPDKVADRIAGAFVDLAYKKQENPKIAVEVLIGHGKAFLLFETSVDFTYEEIESIVYRIIGEPVLIDYKIVPQDPELAKNQEGKIRCGDNGIFKGTPISEEEKELTQIAKELYEKYDSDGKYILDKEQGDRLIICQSNAKTEELKEMYPISIINPLGDWTGGINVDSGATNRKLGSDMGAAVTGGGLCLSGDSEYLGEDLKWHSIKDYSGEKIAQWNNGNLEFVYPTKYIYNEKDDLIYIHNDYKLSMCLTPYHQMLIKTSKANFIKKEAGLIAEKLSKGIGNSGSIIHTFNYQPLSGRTAYLDENDYRLQVAFCADGTILNNSNKWNGQIRVKKENKKIRLRELLKGKEYSETQDKDYSIFWYKFTKQSKSLYECFKNENWDTLKDEVFNWDGNKNLQLFRTTNKEDADFIQLVLQSYGNCVGITQSDQRGKVKRNNDKEYVVKSILYLVHVYKSKTTGLCSTKGTKIKVEYLNDKQSSYCFNVPSHNLIIRHNNKIFITGNCGKDCSKADVSVNIYCHLKATALGRPYELNCAIGDEFVDGRPYSKIVQLAKEYIDKIGGFEKLAEWGLIR